MQKSKVNKGQEASSLFTELQSTQEILRKMSISLGRTLNKLKKDGMWKNAVGDGITTWREFLSQPEIGMTEHEAKFLITLDNSCRKYGLAVFDLPLSAMRVILKYEKDGEKVVRELMSAAQSLSLKDLKELRHEVKTSDAPKTYKYVVMKKCNETGGLSMVHSVKNEELLDNFGSKLAE
jgi:hypothetical protein